jgi:hypothetical protein
MKGLTKLWKPGDVFQPGFSLFDLLIRFLGNFLTCLGFHEGGTKITEGAVDFFTLIFLGGGFRPPVFLVPVFAGCFGVGFFGGFGLAVESCDVAGGFFFVAAGFVLLEAPFNA